MLENLKEGDTFYQYRVSKGLPWDIDFQTSFDKFNFGIAFFANGLFYVTVAKWTVKGLK